MTSACSCQMALAAVESCRAWKAPPFDNAASIVSGTVISTLVYAALVVANHALFSIIPGVVGQWLGAIPFLTVGIPAVISLYFDWFGSFMQAFIFCMLTMMFISTAAE